MNRQMTRLIAAIVAACDSQTAKAILDRLDLERQAEIRKEIQSFASRIDVRAWRKVISSTIIDDLHKQLNLHDSAIVDISGYRTTQTPHAHKVDLGTKSLQSLERIIASTTANNGAA